MTPHKKKASVVIAIATVITMVLAYCCAETDTPPYPQPPVGVGPTRYSNPVVAENLPDPTVIKAPDGYFYVYATTQNTDILRSDNLVNWYRVGTAFSGATRPNWLPGGGVWAPDINYIDGKWVLYYSMAIWGQSWTCGIGVATADKPEGPFTDKGKMFRSDEIDVPSSIDPFYIEEGGRKYIFWGSFKGIYAIELSDDGLSVKSGAEKRRVAGTAFEGTYIHKRDGKYYMFASVGSCCEGLKSTYRLVVGRSDNLFGPYVDRSGKDMLNNGFEVVIDKSDHFVGNGHCSEIVQDDAGEDWILYHGVNAVKPQGRMLLLDRVLWNDRGWPYVETGKPSVTYYTPVFN